MCIRDRFTTPGFFDVDPDTLGGWEAKIRKAVREIHASKWSDNQSEMRTVERDETGLHIDNLEMDLQTLLGETANHWSACGFAKG